MAVSKTLDRVFRNTEGPESGQLQPRLCHLLHSPQHLREGNLGEGAEERVGFELAASLAGGGEAGQETAEGSRVGQGLGQVRGLAAQVCRLAQAGLVEV